LRRRNWWPAGHRQHAAERQNTSLTAFARRLAIAPYRCDIMEMRITMTAPGHTTDAKDIRQ
jgi:hypothetical protein